MAPPNRRAAAPKRKKQDDFFHEDDEAAEFFDDGTNATNNVSDASDASSEEEETAEQKRLRLAKDYLSEVRAAEAAGLEEEEESGEEDEGGVSALDVAVARRLKQDAADARGWSNRRLADRVVVASDWESQRPGSMTPGARFHRGHSLAVTGLALTTDDRTLYSVSKDGSVLRHDVESGSRDRLDSGARAGSRRGTGAAVGGAPWMRPGARNTSKDALLAVAVSSDGVYVAAGGGRNRLYVWDTRAGLAPVKTFPGHKDAVTALGFRGGTHELFSGSLDRSVKIWSLDDMAYLDTLFGHQAEVLGLDVQRAERVVTAGADRTCRLWKVPEESQLIFRGSYPVIECCAFTRGGEWVTGDADGALGLWNQTRKKPVHAVQGAHAAAPGASAVAGQPARGILSVAACPGSDLVASGAADGFVRLWGLEQGQQRGAGAHTLRPVGGLPARGFVNALAFAHSARFVAAGLGQEPRLGRWARDGTARNGVLIVPLTFEDQPPADEH